ncbi:hypothetical protein ACFYO7_30010 [Nocardia salmonicida]|uniref:hypothetical protein n=1 Tax=Nocardia salmonicida TaxID=53431 RepID=UPI0036B5CD71
MPRIVGRRSDGGVVVAVGGVCVVVGSHALDTAGQYVTPPENLRVMLVSATATDSGFTTMDEPVPDHLLSAAQIAAILDWEVGFVEGAPGDNERPGLSAAETELYLRYRPDTGDEYPHGLATEAVDRPFSLERIIMPTVLEPPGPREDGELEPEPVVLLCASMAYVENLSGDGIAVAAAEDLIDGISYVATVEDFYQALTQAFSAETLPDSVVELAGGYSMAEILEFFGRLLAELDRRRPWPPPVAVPVDPHTWPTPGSSRLVGSIDSSLSALEWAVKAGFADVPDDDQVVLVLRLRTGQLIALVGEQGHAPTKFLVLLPDLEDQQDPVEVAAYLSRYTGLRVEFDGSRAEVTAR